MCWQTRPVYDPALTYFSKTPFLLLATRYGVFIKYATLVSSAISIFVRIAVSKVLDLASLQHLPPIAPATN